ncbi:hypothetical protein HMPREF9711_00716 [Myroides odoratimimus CCUG 3837]|uniref:FRG domain-containing protein n=1 Tax=Myroides odoratimimus TaxID=76832 RepID=UPI000280A95B|nr:FRG domain-containing protein [Myroides odoratimimus]EKB06344.1 hypothetical protein HMPREF9711_00716 [Myroides odoratimimus CCUG 3837]
MLATNEKNYTLNKFMDKNFDLKYQLTNEYLRTGGVEKIPDQELLQDIIDFNLVNPQTHTSKLKAFMNLIFNSHLREPIIEPEYISEFKSFVQKSFCFDQIKIDTKEEFDEIYDKFRTTKNFLFRGQREAKWRLYSSLQRNWILNKLYKTEDSYVSFLERLVMIGKETYSSNIQEILNQHHVDTINSISVLGFLQHHGCPTPLLDWTYKFQNALFFGLDGITPNDGPTEIGNYFSIYFIDEENMVAGGMRKIMDDSLEELDKEYLMKSISFVAKDEKQRLEMIEYFKGRKFFDKKRIPGAGLISFLTEITNMINFPLTFFSDKDAETGFIFSLNNSKNILNQNGVFTWNADPIKPLEVVGKEQYFIDEPKSKTDDYRFCNCYNINKDLKAHIAKRLEEDGINKDYIYPTKDISTWEIFVKSQK